MSSWTNATPATTPQGVILRQSVLDSAIDRLLASPAPQLTDWVELYWGFAWDTPHTIPGSLVPQFAVNLTFEDNVGRTDATSSVLFTGVPEARFDADPTGRGHVVGVKLLPGTFTALTGLDSSVLTGRTVPAADVLPDNRNAALPSALTEFTEVAGTPPVYGDDSQVGALDDLLRAVVPDRVPEDCVRARTALQDATLPEVVRVDQLAERHGVTVRTLQRLFDRWIGVSPKQVITRLRLQDAVAALDQASRSARPEPLVDIAIRLGFFDQAHLTREFTRVVGVPPTRYLSDLTENGS